MRTANKIGGEAERKLTLIACKDIVRFYDRTDGLAELDRDSNARALVRLTDRQNGQGLVELRAALREEDPQEAIWSTLLACAGYYDLQGLTTVPNAATVLRLSQSLVTSKRITTSTCFVGAPLGSAGAAVPEGSPLHPLLQTLGERLLNEELVAMDGIGACNGWLTEAMQTVLEKFRQLDGTGFVPGSRLLLWTCLDALRHFEEECEEFLARYKAAGSKSGLPEGFHQRQRNYGDFLRAISAELDRRVSLSLPAYTRFFPCAIEAPLKVVGALDVASRLLATSFSAYQCRAKSTLLQVFTTDPGKPTHYRKVGRAGWNALTGRPYATLATTTLSPSTLHYFPIALFNIFHEVAQCVIGGTMVHPSFSALVHAQAQVERVAGITTLAALRERRTELTEISPTTTSGSTGSTGTKACKCGTVGAGSSDWPAASSIRSRPANRMSAGASTSFTIGWSTGGPCGCSPPAHENGRRASMLQVNATVVVNGQKRRMTVQFTVYDNSTYRVAAGPFFNEYKSPEQRAKEAEDAQKRRESEETPIQRYLRTGNLEEYKASQAKEQHQADAAKQQVENQRRQNEEAATKAAESERVAAATSRLFVTNWKSVTGKINQSSNLSVVPFTEPSRVESKRHYDLDKGYIFSLVFSRAESETTNAAASASKALGALSSLMKARVETQTSATSQVRNGNDVRNLKLGGFGVESLKGFAVLIEKFRSWSKTATDNKVVGVEKKLGEFESATLTFSVDSAGAPSLRWEKGMVVFSQPSAEVDAMGAVIKSALEQIASLNADCLKRASAGEDIKSKEDLFK